MTWAITRPGDGAFSSKIAENTALTPNNWWFLPYDQLNLELLDGKECNGIILIESTNKAKSLPYHKQKLFLVISSIRHFAVECNNLAIPTLHVSTNGPYHEVIGELSERLGPINVNRPSERSLRIELESLEKGGKVIFHKHPGWLTEKSWFVESNGLEPPFRMDKFYRKARKELGWLMDNGKPRGGKYSFDSENRKPWKYDPIPPRENEYEYDSIDYEVVKIVNTLFPDNPGDLGEKKYPTSSLEVREAVNYTLRVLPHFGDYEDAMSAQSKSLFHTKLSPLLNLHRVMPAEIADVALNSNSPLNSVEGLLRQLIWREYVHHIHEITDGFRTLEVSKTESLPRNAGWDNHQISITSSLEPNHLEQTNPLPLAYWGRKTRMNCLDSVVESVIDDGWTHHIPRLMILGNFSQLLDIEPRQITDWFHSAFVDAFDWVVEPNVLGMATFGLGESMMTKPYVCGSPYIKKMSDYCDSCDLSKKNQCPVTNLYWAYLERHRGKLEKVQRMTIPMRNLSKRSDIQKAEDVAIFDSVSNRLQNGLPVIE